MKSQSIFFVLLFTFICGISVNATNWTVTKSSNSNDGICDTDCSLREAVASADSGDEVKFSDNLIGQTFLLGGSEITVTKRITIDGFLNDPNVVFLSGNDTSRHFHIQSGAALTLKNMILVQGNSASSGSITTETNAALSLDRVSIRGNRSENAGALYLFGAGNHVITNSSITGNTGTFAPAILVSANGSLYMSNTTVSRNRNIVDENTAWGTITSFSSNSVVIRNCTITANEANRGGGIYAAGSGSINVGNSIIAGNTAAFTGQDIFYASSLVSAGGNLVQNLDTIPGGVFTQTNDVTNVNALLAPTNSLQGGHPIDTHPLQAGSPAINGGINSLAVEPLFGTPLTQDARGVNFPRIFGGTVDKGAFEDQTDGASLIVTKLSNSNDGICALDCSLREAVAAAASDAGTETINFTANVFGTLDLGGSEILIQNNDLNIVGYPSLSAETLIISGNDTNRIFRINNSDVSITGITFADGNGVGAISSGFGGAIYAYSGANITLNKVIVRNNEAATYGALYLLGGNHRIINSTINNNRAANCIAIGNVNGTLNMANATLSTNLDSNSGTGAGALCNINATANIRNSTISFNRIGSDPGAGIWSNGTLNLGNTIVSNNIGGFNTDINNASGTIVSVGGNLVQDQNGFDSGIFTQTNDIIGVDPLLNALTNNGGNVTTHALSMSSPAINLGVNSNAVDPFDNSILTQDARSIFNRISNFTVDKGAYESLIPTAAGISVSGRVMVGKNGLTNASVYLTDQQGNVRSVVSSSFGNYKFENVIAGETYVITVISKRFQFSSQIISASEDIADLDFVAAS